MKIKASFIEPMLLARTDNLPEHGSRWIYELKWDGFRTIAFKTSGEVYLRSRNDNDFSGKYPEVVKALATLPADTVVDGEVVALDEAGRPSFNIWASGGPRRFSRCYHRRMSKSRRVY